MKKQFALYLGFFFFTITAFAGHRQQNTAPHGHQPLKPRVVILTDVSTWETDDSESLVRLFAYADMVEIEGIVYTTGWSLSETRDDFFQLIHKAIDAYAQDVNNLMKRSGQEGFQQEEDVQPVGYWPSPEYLRERTVKGSRHRGMSWIGAENTSEGSRLIIRENDSSDKRPLWILCWGGANTLSQAIWQIRQERSKKECRQFLDKLRVYAITDQDRDQKTPFDTSSQFWLRKQFGKQLFYLWDESAWLYLNGTGKNKWNDYATHIQKHGRLGNVYPKYKYGVEGDTPSLLHVLPLQLNDPEQPEQAGWGGYFEWGKGEDKVSESFVNHSGTKAHDIASHYAAYFYAAGFNDFAARMDWANEGRGNRNPVVRLKDLPADGIIHLKVRTGQQVRLDASPSYDPDKDKLTVKWWVQPEAGTFRPLSECMLGNRKKLTLTIPDKLQGKTLHVICEITDNGTPQLTGYRRIILHIL